MPFNFSPNTLRHSPPFLAPIPETGVLALPNIPSQLQLPPFPKIANMSALPKSGVVVKSIELPIAFYEHPKDAVALFSTREGKFGKRSLPNPPPLPIARSHYEHDVYLKSDALREEFKDAVWSIKAVDSWYDLYKYFDAYDLWVEGAVFCLHVLQNIAEQIKMIKNENNAEIDSFAKEWVAEHENLLISIDVRRPVSQLFDQFDLANFDDMRPEESLFFENCLDKYRRALLQKHGMLAPLHVPIIHPVKRAERMPMVTYGQSPAGTYVYAHGPLPARPDHPPLGAAQSQIQHQTYSTFMDNQRERNMVGASDHIHQLAAARSRGWSNTSHHSGRNFSNESRRISGHFAQQNPRATNNFTSHSSPPRSPRASMPAEPLYVLGKPPSPPQKGHHALYNPAKNCMEQQRKGWGAQYSPPKAIHPNSQAPNAVPQNHFVHPGSGAIHPILINDARVLESIEAARTLLNPEIPIEATCIPFYPEQPKESVQAPFNPERSTGNKGTVTWHYTAPPSRLDYEQSSARTAYVSPVSMETFHNHVLKEMMSQCGIVESISFLPFGGSEGGQCFVQFPDQDCVYRAIEKWNGFPISSGVTLFVGFKKTRKYSGSNSSQQGQHHIPNYKRSTTNESGFDHQQGRRPFFHRNQSSSYHSTQTHSRQSSGMGSPQTSNNHHAAQYRQPSGNGSPQNANIFRQTYHLPAGEPLRSSFSEIEQHNNAMNRLQGANFMHPDRAALIAAAESVSLSHQQQDMNSNMFPPKHGRKEIFPMPGSMKSTPHSTPRKRSPQKASKQWNKNGKKDSRQNTSTNPTPAGSPSRVCLTVREEHLIVGPSRESKQPEEDRKEVSRQNTPALPTPTESPSSLHRDVSEEKTAVETSQPRKPKSKSKKKQLSCKTELAHSASNVDFISPTETVFTEETGMNKSMASSFTTSFSSQEPSIASGTTKLEEGIARDSTLEKAPVSGGSETGEIKKLPSQVSTVHASRDTTPVQAEVTNTDSKKHDQEPLSAKPQKSGPNPKAEHHPSKRKSDMKSETEVTINFTVATATENPSSKAKPSDSKPDAQGNADSDAKPVPTRETQKENVPISTPKSKKKDPKININDQSQWPALEPGKSPVSSIADGKRPPPPTIRPPTIGTLLERGTEKDGHIKKIRPAVPAVAVPRINKQRTPRA